MRHDSGIAADDWHCTNPVPQPNNPPLRLGVKFIKGHSYLLSTRRNLPSSLGLLVLPPLQHWRMSSQSSRRLLTRLRQDLAELQDNPYPGVAVFTDDANLRELCLVLTPPSGPWKNLALHFAVELPENWVPPSSLNLIKVLNVFGF